MTLLAADLTAYLALRDTLLSSPGLDRQCNQLLRGLHKHQLACATSKYYNEEEQLSQMPTFRRAKIAGQAICGRYGWSRDEVPDTIYALYADLKVSDY